MIDVKTKNYILLTGAGFTKNFGGFLAEEMWAFIFNNPFVQQSPELRSRLQKNFDFESIYTEVMSEAGSSIEEKGSLLRAVYDAYRSLDDAIRGTQGAGTNWYGVKEFLHLFKNEGDQKGFIFTLNQDLFLERQFQCNTPGVPEFNPVLYDRPGEELPPSQFAVVDREGIEERALNDIRERSGITYVKLHGSFGWSSLGKHTELVIGTQKEGLIGTDPLLKWYFDLFQSVIAQGKKKLLIIGYGFRDTHINKILLEGVQKHGLRIYIVSTKGPRELLDHMRCGQYYATPIFDGLSGYYPYPLCDIFPPDQSQTVHYKNLKRNLLED